MINQPVSELQTTTPHIQSKLIKFTLAHNKLTNDSSQMISIEIWLMVVLNNNAYKSKNEKEPLNWNND